MTQPLVQAGDSGIQTSSHRQMQRICGTQGGGRFDEHGGGTKISRLDFRHAQLGGGKSLEVGERLLARFGIDGANPLLDAVEVGHFGQGPR